MSHFLGTPARSHLWWLSAQGKDADEAKKFRQRLLSGPMVDIYVGKERKLWSLHRNLLCHHSPYFETELLGHEVPKKQNGDGIDKLELPEDDPRGFELFVKWLYQGQLDDVSNLDNDEKYEYAVACHKLYLLSSKFSMPHLSNLAIDAYRQNLNAAHLVPDADEINDIYRLSPPGSPFRRLMTKIAARQIMDPEIDKDAETYRAAFEHNPDFAVEMVNAIRYSSGGMLFDNPTDGKECDWHDHTDGRDCSGQKLGKGKGKASVPYVNGVSVSNSRHIQSPAMTRVRSTPLAELPVDKRTPRKLNLPPQHPAQPGAQQTSTTRGKGRVPSTPLQNATGVSPSPKKPVANKPRPVLGKRASSYTKKTKTPTTPPRKTASAETSPIKVAKRPKEQTQGSPPKAPANSPAATNGVPSKALDASAESSPIQVTKRPKEHAQGSPLKPPANAFAATNDALNQAPDAKSSPQKKTVPARRAVTGPAQLNGVVFDGKKANGDSTASKKTSPNQDRSHVNGIVKQLNGANSTNEVGRIVDGQTNGTPRDGFSADRAGAPSEAGTTTTTATAETTSGSSQDLDGKEPVKMKRKVPG